MPELERGETELNLIIQDNLDYASAVMTLTGLGQPTSDIVIEQIMNALEGVEGLSVKRRGAGGVTHD